MAEYAKYASEIVVEKRMKDLGISAAKLAPLAEVQPTRLSHAFSGQRPFEGDLATRLLTLTAQLEALVEAAKPFLLPLDDVNDMRAILVTIRLRGITPTQIAEALKFLKSDE